MFYVSLLFHIIIANEVPVTILLAYIPILWRIRKGLLIRRIIASRLSTESHKSSWLPAISRKIEKT